MSCGTVRWLGFKNEVRRAWRIILARRSSQLSTLICGGQIKEHSDNHLCIGRQVLNMPPLNMWRRAILVLNNASLIWWLLINSGNTCRISTIHTTFKYCFKRWWISYQLFSVAYFTACTRCYTQNSCRNTYLFIMYVLIRFENARNYYASWGTTKPSR